MKRIGWILVCLVLSLSDVCALTKEEYMHHELRVGWGDMLFETSQWHTTTRTNHYRYTGHVFAEYQYFFRPWFSLGGQVDYEQVWWDVFKQKNLILEQPLTDRTFYNVSVLPTLRFTYYHHPYVNIYFALSFGITVNGGSEKDMKERYTAVAPGWDITFLGVKAGKDHWFGTIEIGGLNALTGRNYIYMVGSRIFTASVGCSF